MKQGLLNRVEREAMRRRLSHLAAAAEDDVYRLWRSGLDCAQAEMWTAGLSALQAELRTLRTEMALSDALWDRATARSRRLSGPEVFRPPERASSQR